MKNAIIIIVSLLIHGIHGLNDTDLCPVWMRTDDNSSPDYCQCELRLGYTCNGNKSFDLGDTICISFDEIKKFIITGYCPYSYNQQSFLKNLNTSITSGVVFNKVMCGPLYREGLLCSKCISGYGIPVFSRIKQKCVKCGSTFAWPLYLTLVLLPITMFYLIVIVFNFSATHPPITAFVFYCQLFTLFMSDPHVRYPFEVNINHIFLYTTLTICDVWNLNMLRYTIPSFCLNEHLTNIDAAFLEMIAAIYPVFLILLTIVLIEMHANNFRFIVCLWRPFHKCFSSLRRSWDPKSSVINAFATFLLLSSFKVCFLAFSFMEHSKIRSIFFLGEEVLYMEPTTKLSELPKHAYFITVILLITFFMLIPSLLLCLYPTKLFKLMTKHICSTRQQNALFLFMDCFQGHYKNGTTGTYDYRSASSIEFVLRIGVSIICIHKVGNYQHDIDLSNAAYVLLGVSIFYALAQPCKKRYKNAIETLLYFAAGFLFILIHTTTLKNTKTFHIILLAFLMPSVIFVGIIIYKVFDFFGIVRKVKHFIAEKNLFKTNGVSSEAEPHRLTHPSQYTPLLK